MISVKGYAFILPAGNKICVVLGSLDEESATGNWTSKALENLETTIGNKTIKTWDCELFKDIGEYESKYKEYLSSKNEDVILEGKIVLDEKSNPNGPTYHFISNNNKKIVLDLKKSIDAAMSFDKNMEI